MRLYLVAKPKRNCCDVRGQSHDCTDDGCSVLVFNAVVNACVVEIPPMILRILNLPESKDPNKVNLPSTKNKVWKKIKNIIEEYLKSLLQVMNSYS